MCQGLIDPSRIRRDTEERVRALRTAAILAPTGTATPSRAFSWLRAALQRLTSPRRSGTPLAKVAGSAGETR